MALVLKRKRGQPIVIAENIRVTVVDAEGGSCRLAIEAPPEVRVDREEVHLERAEFAAKGGAR